MVKVVSLFLIAMIVLAMLGRLKMPKIGLRKGRPKVAEARKCPDCGNYVLTGADCGCKSKK